MARGDAWGCCRAGGRDGALPGRAQGDHTALGGPRSFLAQAAHRALRSAGRDEDELSSSAPRLTLHAILLVQDTRCSFCPVHSSPLLSGAPR